MVMRQLILIFLVLAVSGLLAAPSVSAQDSLYSQCGVLWQTDECMIFQPNGSILKYLIENPGGFGDGDSVFVSGVVFPGCNEICAEADYCLSNDTIGACESYPYEYFSGVGMLMQRSECLLFYPLSDPDEVNSFYVLESYGDFVENDTVFVEGSIFLLCTLPCTDATGCIVNNSIAEPPPLPGYPFSSYGVMFLGADCLLFAPNSDSTAALELDNVSDFQPGDSVFVSGELVYDCNSPCSDAIGCVLNTVIDSVWINTNLIEGSIVIQLMPTSSLLDFFQPENMTYIDSIISQNIYLINYVDSLSTDSVIISLLGSPGVIFAEPNFGVDYPENLQLSISFPDEYAPQLDVDLGEPASFYEQSCLQVIESDSAQILSEGGNTTIAVIDNGFDFTHPLLQYVTFVDGYDYFDTGEYPLPDSGLGASHGTFVTGLIKLISPESQIMPLRALGPSGKGNTFAIAKSIYHAIRFDADVINMSFGSYHDSYLLRSACQNALDAGIVLVAAGGNDSTVSPIYPAAYPGVIGVSAIDNDGFAADFSNYGSSIDICAPGVDIYSTLTGGYEWGTWTGTSFSTPQVAAACAMIRSVNPGFTVDEIRTHLCMTAQRDLGPGTIDVPDPYYGYGRLDVAGAIWTLASMPAEEGCGDVNLDDAVNVSDAVYLINYIFSEGGAPPADLRLADVNSDGRVNVSDAIYLINYVYQGGSAPVCPAP